MFKHIWNNILKLFGHEKLINTTISKEDLIDEIAIYMANLKRQK